MVKNNNPSTINAYAYLYLSLYHDICWKYEYDLQAHASTSSPPPLCMWSLQDTYSILEETKFPTKQLS